MSRETILIVEDELLIAMDIKGILEEEGYDVISNVVSVEEAMECINNVNPQLVLIDINLKGNQTGIDLGNYLLEKDQIPYIYITSYSDKTTIEKVNETRPYGFVVKPFKTVDIKTTVSVVLNNFKHRKIDVVRHNSDINNDIPFRIKEIIQFINLNINEKIEVAELAQKSRWKREHFIKMFAQYTGHTPYQYILKRKIEKAQVLLRETDVPLNEIAYELSFLSYSNFVNAFKKQTAMTPESYRKKAHLKKYL